MGSYRIVNNTFWTDPKVEDDFTPEDKYFFLYLLTNMHTNLCGCYEISKRQMSKETGYNVEVIDNLIYRFKSIHKVIDYDENTKEILIINWHKYNWSNSEKLIKGIENTIDYIENESFRSYVRDVLEAHRNCSKAYPIYRVSYPIDTVSYPMHTSVSVSVSNSVSDTVTVSNSDIEKENNISTSEIDNSNTKEKSIKPKAKITAMDMLSEKGFPEDLEKTVYEWVVYKNEKRQSYKQTGFRNFLSQIENNTKQYGVDRVIEVIRLSMAQNWQGVAWNQIDAFNKPQAPPGGKYSSGKSGSGEYVISDEDREDSV